ncbi:Alpha/Beta hydrolase protein [Leptodontidium sp. 2 PMI_412]|nr:Alpha/Beta hydrolase protein [Leptodontidium sp. 2 PMI_412]
MKSQSLGLIVISGVAILVNSVSAKAQSSKEHFANLKYKDFIYPPRAHAHALKDNQIDLDYEIHEAQVNDKFLAFRNIPYAEPPTTSEYRFMPPDFPQTVSEQVNNGSVDHKCPQAQVGWVPFAEEFLKGFGGVLDYKWRNEINPEDYGDMPDPIDGVDEDCLTLDVMVPKTVWENRNNDNADPAAVIVWIYGGGFIFGWKDQYGSPAGLFDAASGDDYGNVIYVAINYRLGAFGWLGGPQFMADGGTPNLGLHDQRLAMAWVQHYVEKFGGDPYRITVMGQSAGASSVLHHITAGGGREFTPVFDKAVIQSAGFFPQPDPTYDDRIYQKYLNLTGAKDLDELVRMNTSILQDANARMTFDSPYGIFNFGPTVDGKFVTDLPGKLLANQENHEGISLMVGHMAYDGLLFTPPWIRTNAQLREHSAKLYPGIPESVKNKITELYPINWWIELAQKKIAVVADFLDDIAIQCNSYYLTEAALTARLPVPVFRYSFNALPAIHGYDTGYTYYPSPSPMGEANETLAKFFQKSIVNFARTGIPYIDAEGDDLWDLYNVDRKVMNFGKPRQTEPDFSHAMGDDLMDVEKCSYWQSAPYYVAPENENVGFVEQDELK